MAVNANDQRRNLILRFLYDLHHNARGIAKMTIGIRDLQSEMKKLEGMSQQEVAANLDYLVQVGWVREVIKERSITTAKGMKLANEQVKYKISDVGINYLEAGTVFKRPEVGSSVNITNIRGVTIVGDGNVVNASYTDVARRLDHLDRVLAESRALSDEQKLDAAGDIATIRTQIGKLNPNAGIIQSAWESLSAMATIAGASDLAASIWDLLRQAIGGDLP